VSIAARFAIEELAMVETVDLALLLEVAGALEPDPRFEPKAPIDHVLLANEEGRDALKRVAVHAANLFRKWLDQNRIELDPSEERYIKRVAEGRVSADSLGLLRAMVKLHTAGHEPRDPFARYATLH
jgi:hypothetical protein